MTQVSLNDDNMVPGQTYTFQFSLDNLITRPSTSTLQADATANAPSFIQNVSVTSIPTVNPLENDYNVQFTYNGDGTDVIQDVANSLVAAFKSVSNDDLTFTQAFAEPAGSVPSGGVQGLVNQVTEGVTSTVNSLGAQTSKTAQDLLTPIEIAVAILAVILIGVIFFSGKAGGASASAEGVSIGGK